MGWLQIKKKINKFKRLPEIYSGQNLLVTINNYEVPEVKIYCVKCNAYFNTSHYKDRTPYYNNSIDGSHPDFLTVKHISASDIHKKCKGIDSYFIAAHQKETSTVKPKKSVALALEQILA